MSNPFIINVGENHSFKISPDSLDQLDFIPVALGQWHLVENGITYHVSLLNMDYAKHQIQLSINGEVFDIDIEDKYAQLIDRLGLSKEVAIQITDIKAPMPGLILQINLQEGDSFSEGDPLLILEAMKMENVLKAPCDGTISKILVKAGDPVEKGQILIEL